MQTDSVFPDGYVPTIFSRVSLWVMSFARRVSRSARHIEGITSVRRPPPSPLARSGAALTASLTLGLPPFLVFGTWMHLVVLRGDPSDRLVWAIWLAGSWLLVAPALIVVWDLTRAKTLGTLVAQAKIEHWPAGSILRWSKRLDGLLIRQAIFCGLCLVMVVAYLEGASQIYGLWHGDPSWSIWTVIGLASCGWLGFTFGVGSWGVVVTLVTTYVALRKAPREGRAILWDPFDPDQAAGMERIAGWAYTTAFLFSCGAVFLPALYLAIPELSLVPQVAGIAIAVVLTTGGLASFLLPSWWMAREARRQINCELKLLHLPLKELKEQLEGTSATTEAGYLAALNHRATALLAMRQAIASERAAPVPLWWATRISTVLLIPVVITLVDKAFN